MSDTIVLFLVLGALVFFVGRIIVRGYHRRPNKVLRGSELDPFGSDC